MGSDEQSAFTMDFAAFYYPVWLSRLLAPLGVVRAQTRLGYAMASFDLCEAARWHHAAARSGDLPSHWAMMHIFVMMSQALDYDVEENKKRAFLWYLNWASRFRPAPGEYEGMRDMLKLSAAEAEEIRERSQTWQPSDDPPFRPRPCPQLTH